MKKNTIWDILISIPYLARFFFKRNLVKYKLPHKLDKVKDIFVLGNGPSLNKDLDHIGQYREQVDLVAVNFFGLTPLFEKLKPRHYVISDPIFFKENRSEQVNKLFQKFESIANWKMILVVPESGIFMQELLKKNKNISFVIFSNLRMVGYLPIINYFYKKGLAIPAGTNIIIPSLIYAINLGYSRICLFGADHSWLKTLSVDFDDNLIHMDEHYYDKKKRNLSEEFPETKFPVYAQIMNMKKLFEAYHLVDRYARMNDCVIYNTSSATLLDIFKRKDPQQLSHV